MPARPDNALDSRPRDEVLSIVNDAAARSADNKGIDSPGDDHDSIVV